ncbi:DUF1289 domain-containing protein [Pannonibacter sp. Pt2]|uniref:DUF1289 domain-containing protein n=2 Tax=Pannonibacter anstelovis TaxID=3121537 RepID=A0ABU7ZQT1_9HYPH
MRKRQGEPMAGIESPCVKVCIMDPVSGLCRGCARTLEEIAGWAGFAPEHRRQVMMQLDARRARMSASPGTLCSSDAVPAI